MCASTSFTSAPRAKSSAGGTSPGTSRANAARWKRLTVRRAPTPRSGYRCRIVDPSQTYIDVDVRIGADTIVHPLTFLEVGTRVGSHCDASDRTSR